MIQFCTCNKRLTPPPEVQESSKSCISCGGTLSFDKLCDLSKTMWSTVGPEFSGLIDPQLKWKTSSNGKHRAVRRARTFTQYNRKKLTAKNTEDIGDLIDETLKKEGDMLVSESEKFGVSVLGRRFSDNLESVPIKKRRFSLLPQSTPHILPSSGFHGHNDGGRFCLLQNSQGSLKQDESDIYASHVVDWGQEKISADEKRCLLDIDEHAGDSADFSGISILAAAACRSSTEKGFMDAKGLTVKGHSFEENPSSLRFSELLEHKDQPSKLELGNKPEPSVASLTAEEAVDGEPVRIKFGEDCKEENSFGSLQNFSSKRKSGVSLRDDRLHWDLNTVMDVWESQSDDFSNSDPLDNCHASYDMEYGNQGVGQDEAIFGTNKLGLIAADNQDISQCFEENDRIQASPVDDCDEGKCGSRKTQVCEPLQEECQVKDVKVMVAYASEETGPAGVGEKSCVVSRNGHPIEDIAQSDGELSTKLVDVSEEEKNETDNVIFNVEVETHNTLLSLVSTGNATPSRTMNACDPCSADKNVKKMLHDDSMSIATVGSCNDHSGECHPAYVGKGYQLKSQNSEKHQCVSADAPISITAQKSPAGQLDQSISGIIIHGDEITFQASLDGSSSKSMTTYCCLADETAYIDEFSKAYANVNQSFHFNSKGASDNEQLPSSTSCINQYKETCADLKADDSKSYILSDESLTASTVVPFHTSLEHTNSISEGLRMERNDIPLADNILIYHEDCRTPADSNVSRSVKDSLEEHLDSEHYSDACPIGTDHATGLEKVEFLGDDDSQYEDGEVRESVLHSWGEDGVEEAETEYVDYGSDCREADFSESESESDFCSQSDLADETTECKHEGKLVSTFSDGSRLGLIEDDSPSKCFQTHILIKDTLNIDYGEGHARKNLDVSVASELIARDETRLLSSNIPTEASDVPGKSSQPDSSKLKSSGWDKLPKRKDAAVDPVWNHDGASVTSVNREYARRLIVSSVKRDSASRVERSKASEASRRKEVSYSTENKKLNHFDLNTEKNANTSRSIGRSKLPFRSHGRGRVDCWVDSPDHRGNCHFDTSGGHYSSPKFVPPGSRNAAAAAVAKVESNGFVVAPDGTICKAVSSMGLSVRSSNSSPHLQSTRRGSTMESDGAFDMSSEPSNSTREVSPVRCFNVGGGRGSRHGSRFISLGHRNMFQAPILDRRRIDPQSLRHHPSSWRQRSFSPQRRPMHLSREHTRSPSRSKTRSPHYWRSPRGSDNGRMNGDPDVRRQSRSPLNFRSQRRIPRQRSPQRRAMPAEESPAYSPLPRSHSSPPHASRWFDDESIFQGQLREHQPRCPTGPRIDHIDSRERLKPDEYYQPMYSGRFHEYAGYGGGSKHDSRDDGRRGRSNRYESFHSEGPSERNGDMKCFGYGENVIRAHNLHRKSAGFQRRESPRTFDRSIDAAQLKDSRRRIKGEMFHFRRGRDGKLNGDYQSFGGVRDNGDDLALQRRPS